MLGRGNQETTRSFHLENFNFYLKGEEGIAFADSDERDDAILNLVNIAGTHVVFENREIVAYNALHDPNLKNRPRPLFHVSRQLIRYV